MIPVVLVFYPAGTIWGQKRRSQAQNHFELPCRLGGQELVDGSKLGTQELVNGRRLGTQVSVYDGTKTFSL